MAVEREPKPERWNYSPPSLSLSSLHSVSSIMEQSVPVQPGEHSQRKWPSLFWTHAPRLLPQFDGQPSVKVDQSSVGSN